MFQSHYGAIATWVAMAMNTVALFGFNPTMVRLRPSTAVKLLRRAYGFNPTMVRLRPRSAYHVPSFTKPFQSHYGAIATGTLYSNYTAFDLVSIPLWCDCDQKGPRVRAGLTNSLWFSIPLWCDCDLVECAAGVEFFGFNPTMVRLRLIGR